MHKGDSMKSFLALLLLLKFCSANLNTKALVHELEEMIASQQKTIDAQQLQVDRLTQKMAKLESKCHLVYLIVIKLIKQKRS